MKKEALTRYCLDTVLINFSTPIKIKINVCIPYTEQNFNIVLVDISGSTLTPYKLDDNIGNRILYCSGPTPNGLIEIIFKGTVIEETLAI